MNHLVIGGWLTAMWVLLWGDVTPANILGGLVAAGTLLVVFPTRSTTPRQWFRPGATLRFAAYFAVKLIEANIVLAWEIVTPRNRIREGIVAISVKDCRPGLVTLVANAISLTPGTITIEVDPDREELYVHVLHLRDVEMVRHGLLRFRELALLAFGSPGAIAAHAADRAGQGGSADPGEDAR